MNYEFHPEAEQELYDSQAIQLLLEHPELGSWVDSELRHFVLGRFPFSVVYAVTPNLIYIVAVAHGRREPGYWRLRVQDR